IAPRPRRGPHPPGVGRRDRQRRRGGDQPGGPARARGGGAEAARLGIAFAYVPIPGTGFGADEVRAQREAVESAAGPVFAYCRSGTRSANVWALAMAGSVPAEELIEAGRNGGYDLAGLAPMLANRIE
ncbi:MAG: beta-lactamase hydrolase domain-containing protein, partial [Rubricella sp.]